MLNGKNYIGQKKSSVFIPSYKGSGSALKIAFKKYGKPCFKTILIKWYSSKEDLDNAEELATINHNAVKSNSFYNLCDGGHTSSGFITPPETRKKQSLARLGKKPWNKGKKLTDEETRKKMSDAKKGKPLFSKEVYQALAEKRRGIKLRKQEIVKCPTCNKEGGANAMKRYHFDNCKYNQGELK